jgi:GAF domain-containing protein
LTGASCGSIGLVDLHAPDGGEMQFQFQVGETVQKGFTDAELALLKQGEILHQEHLTRDGGELPHAGVDSVLVVPVRVQNRLAGLIQLHAGEPGAFSADEIEIVQSLAVQAAVAFENASLYQVRQQQESMLEGKIGLMNRLFELSQAAHARMTLREVLQDIAGAVRSATGFQVVVLSLNEPDQAALRRVVGLGLGAEVWQELQSCLQPWTGLEPFFMPEFKTGAVFFIPAEKSPGQPAASHSVLVLPESNESGDPALWKPEDMLLAPLYNRAGERHGLISLDAPVSGRRPDAAVLEAFELLAAQAGLLIEERRSQLERDHQLSALELDLKREKEAADQARAQVPLFLRRDLEQTLALQTTRRQVERVRSGLEIAEQANRQPGALEALRTLAREMLNRLELQVALVGENSGGELRLLEVIGSTSTQANPEALFGQRNPLSQLLQDGRMRLVADVEEDSEWRGNALLSGLNGRSFIALPLALGQARTGGVLVMGQCILPPFSESDSHIYAQLSRQVSLGIQNLDLLTETRRRLREMDLLLQFSRKLGMLDPRGILRALIETALQVLSTGDAGWVGLWSGEELALIPAAAQGYIDDSAMQSLRYRPTLDKAVEVLPLRVFYSGQPVRGDVAFAQDYSLPPEALLGYRKATGGRLPVSALVVPVGRGDRPLGVLVIDHFSLSNAFSQEDESLAMALAQQSTLALENARLFISAEQRAAQLQALNQVSAALTSSLRPGELIPTLPVLLKEILPFDTATLWLRKGDRLDIASASGFADNESRLGISVSVQDSALFQEMIRTTQPLVVPDIRLDPRFSTLLEPDHLSW